MCTAQRVRHEAFLLGHMHMNGHLEEERGSFEVEIDTNAIWILHVKTLLKYLYMHKNTFQENKTPSSQS